MKSSIIFFLLFTILVIRGSSQQCNGSITNCQDCNLNSTSTCNQCTTQYKPNDDKSQCIYCPMSYCKSCGSQTQKCHQCIASEYSQYALSPPSQQVTCVPCETSQCECQIPYFCQTCKTAQNGQTSTPDQNGDSCIECTDTNCFRCYENNKCKICKNGFVRNLQDQCKQCNIENCFSCSQNNVCQHCVDNYHLTQQGKCILCNFPCSYCNDDGSCKVCDFPYFNLQPSTSSQNNGECFRPTVPNCIHHDKSDNTKCVTCRNFYTYDSSTNTCILQCGQYCLTCDASDNTKCLSCPQNYYLTTQKTCSVCPVGQKTSSSISTSCTQPKTSYFKLSQNQFKKCEPFCMQCESLDYCKSLWLATGRNLLKSIKSTTVTVGQLLTSTTTAYILSKCAENCIQCANKNSQFCITCQDGFYTNDLGICKSCDSVCKTCSTNDKTKCLSCYLNGILASNTCFICNQNCRTCKSSTQLSVCTSCKNGWSLNTDSNVCQQICPDHCLQCESSTSCLKCITGYSNYLESSGSNNYICLPCIQNCRVCMTGQPQTCIQCGDGFYTLTGQTCFPLEYSFCKSGNEKQCFQCYHGYQLVNELTCQKNCQYPCATCNPGNPSSCKSCIAGYKYQATSQSCVPDLSCNNDCNICPFGNSLYYGDCIQCQLNTISNCQRCDTTKRDQCYSCFPGFYLDSSSKCSSCPKQCTQCFSATQCSLCQDGYFLNKEFSTCDACQDTAGCATCDYQPSFCTSCNSGYTLVGYKCSKNQALQLEITVTKSLLTFNSQYYKDFVKFFVKLLDPDTQQMNIFTLQQLKSVSSSQTKIKFRLAYTFLFDQPLADQKLQTVYNAIYDSDLIILDDLTITKFKAQHQGGYTNVLDNFCTISLQNCYLCQFQTSNCIKCSPSTSLNSLGACESCNVDHCQYCLNGNDICDLCSQKYYLITQNDVPICKSCTVQFCLICYQANTCQKCQSSHTLNQFQTLCIACDIQNCAECFTQTYCKTCSSGFSLDQDTGQCFACTISNCITCQSPLYCKSCNSALNFVLNTVSGKCQVCPLVGCLTCFTTTVCSICSNGYTLQPVLGQCIQCNVVNCIQGCFLPNICSDCPKDNTQLISPFNQTQVLCIPCSIQNCIYCIWQDYCYSCDTTTVATLSPNVYGDTCIICNVENCAVCQSPNVCAFCKYPAALNVKKNICIYCILDNCDQCASLGVCSVCSDGYTPASSGLCVKCPQICLTCLPTGKCITCIQPTYNLLTSQNQANKGQCFLNTIPHCNSQDRKNNSQCISCDKPYLLSQDSSQCITNCDSNCKTCADSQPTTCLTCYDGLFLDNTVCTLCSIGCQTCSSKDLCTTSMNGFFINSQSGVQPCIKGCKKCSSSTTCTQLENSDGISIFKAPSGETQILRCAGNCKACQNSQKCLECRQGFYLVTEDKIKNRQGICRSCNPLCRRCDIQDQNVCTACSDSYFLKNKTCKSCDENCQTCKSSSQPNICLTCVAGKSLDANNTCIPGCPINCLSCKNINDCIACNTGYTTLLDTDSTSVTFNQIICTPCVVSCRLCAPGQPSSCIFCGDGFYRSQGDCLPCSDNCKTCTENQCTACIKNYDLVLKDSTSNQKTCAIACKYPCYQCTIGKPDQCTNCFAGYSLSGKSCVPKLTCPQNPAGCLLCANGYVLDNGICNPCVTQKCEKCLVNSLSTCIYCSFGYYLLDQNTCKACPTQCADCYSQQQCTSCVDGYILQSKKIKRGYKCIKCDDKCKTCQNNQNKCTSCNDGFQLKGWKCDKVFKAQMIHTFDSTVKQFSKQSRVIMFVFLKILGIIDPDAFSFLSVKKGSVILTSSVQLPGASGSSQSADAFAKIKDAASAGTLGGLTVTSSAVEVKGGSASSTLSSSSLGIILGVSIPLGILLIVGVGVLVYFKSKDPLDKYTQYDGTGTDRDNNAITGYTLSKNRIEYQDNSII